MGFHGWPGSAPRVRVTRDASVKDLPQPHRLAEPRLVISTGSSPPLRPRCKRQRGRSCEVPNLALRGRGAGSHYDPVVRIGVLALQGDVANHLRLLAGCGVDGVSVRRESELAELDGLVIPGGESSVMDKLARRVGLYDPLRQRISDGLPVLGTCAGMIMLAERVTGAIEGQQSLGGLDITVRRNAFGRQVDSFEADLVVEGIAEPSETFRAVFIRAPWVEQVAPGGGGARQLPGPRLRCGRPETASGGGTAGGLMATSFHPELTGDDRIHRAFVALARG